MKGGTGLIISVVLVCVLFAVQHGATQVKQDGDVQPGLQMSGAMGATVIDGVSYQFFSLRPDIPIWKFGVGLDLSFYFDGDGNLREEDWDEAGDIIDKVYYLRYGRPADRVYVRAGSLDLITLGYGLIMRRYSNAIEWPQVRRIGLHSKVRVGNVGVEAVVNNFREIESPGLIAGRATYTIDLGLPVILGGTFVHDGNQYLGAKDDDGDGYPNRTDQFAGENDDEHVKELRSFLGIDQIRRLIGLGDLPDILNRPKSISELDEPATVWGVDVGTPLIRGERLNLFAYAQMAQIADYGMGLTVPGVRLDIGPFSAGAEYRIFQEEFVADFFDLSYEVQRVTWDAGAEKYVTKEEKVAGVPAANGIYADAGVNLFGMLDLFGSYQQMFYDSDEDLPDKSVYATATFDATMIPKIGLIEGYFQQPNAEKVFSTESDGTVIGFRVGAEMGQGVMLVYDNKTIYYNGEPNKIMTVETVLTF